MHVGLLASDGCFSSALTALIDVLSTAQADRPGVDPSIPPIRVDVTGTGRKVTTGAGLTVPVTMHLSELPAVDVVVVPALVTGARPADPPDLRPYGSMPSRHIGSAERRSCAPAASQRRSQSVIQRWDWCGAGSPRP
jgi:hypothetical protein